MNLEEILNHRRAVRKYSTTERIDTEKVCRCHTTQFATPTIGTYSSWGRTTYSAIIDNICIIIQVTNDDTLYLVGIAAESLREEIFETR